MFEEFSVKTLVGLESPQDMLNQAGLVLRDLADTPTAVEARLIDRSAHVPESYVDLLYPLTDADIDQVLMGFVRRIETFGVSVKAQENVFGSEQFHRFEKCLTYGNETFHIVQDFMLMPESDKHPAVLTFWDSMASRRLALDVATLTNVFDMFLSCKPSRLEKTSAPTHYANSAGQLRFAKSLYQFVSYCVDMFA